MKRGRTLVVTVVCLIVWICLLFLLWRWRYCPFEPFDSNNLSYYRLNDTLVTSADTMPLFPIFKEALQANGVKVSQSPYHTCKLLLFETLNNVDHTLMRLRIPLSVNYIYGILGSDLLAGKQALYDMMKKMYGADTLLYLPKSYLTSVPDDMESLKNDFDDENVYIMKKNVQRQLGHKITQNLDEMLASYTEYVLIQEMLQDPLIVNKRKINLRVYLLICIISDSYPDFYIYNDGFIYYTPKQFVAGTTDAERTITTGYIDRTVYETNPLTINDLYQYLGAQKSSVLRQNMLNLFNKLFNAYSNELYNLNKGIRGTKFSIYGCDIAPNSQLHCQLMEVNKGPDLSYKDDRDKAVKLHMVQEALSIIGINTFAQPSNFIKII